MAMAKSLSSSSLKCNLQVIGAKNVRTKQKGSLFVRCYLFSGNNSRIQLNTREINLSSSSSATQNAEFLFWDDDFSLECNGTEDSITKLKQDSVVFELRLRKTSSLLGRIRGSSQVLARGEIPWKSIFETPKMEIETWVALSPSKVNEEEGKPPALKIAMKVEVPAALSREEARKRRRGERLRQGDECGCCKSTDYCSCADNELLFVTGVFDAL